MNLVRNQMETLLLSIDKKIDDKISQMKTEVYEKFKEFSTSTNLNIDIFSKNVNDGFVKIKEEFKEMKANSENKNHIYKEAITYHNIIQAIETGVVSKSGNPVGWNEITHRSNTWNGRTMICIGDNFQNNENGLKTTIPQGYDVLWLRSHNN
jgi:hypothetical protein